MTTTRTAVSTLDNLNMTALLEQAVNQPGQISDAFRAFHGYSFGNMLLAWVQCLEREIPLGPIATFNRWKELGRHVKKGQKALVLCMPITITKKTDGAEPSADEPKATFTRFIYKPRWFVLAQTDGVDVAQDHTPAFDHVKAMHELNIEAIEFDHLNGNVQGFARGRSLAINPVCVDPHMTRFHEMAHVLLGHTPQGVEMTDGVTIAKEQKELEAECVAYLCGAALNVGNLGESRAYIQGWWGRGNPVPEASAQKIIKTVDQILKAGAPSAPALEQEAA
jgi:antirestriction protein ArdC